MKPQTLVIASVVLLYLSACASTKTTSETIQQTTQKIENKDFTIKVNYAVPLRMRQIVLTSDYDIRVKNDSAFAYLPYYGVARVAPMNPAEGGIKFEEKMIDYLILPNKKNDGWEISFKVNTRLIQYQVYMNIYNNGSSSVNVNSHERDAISFHGEIN